MAERGEGGPLTKAPPFPEHLHVRWRCFVELNGSRPSSGFGVSAISRRDVAVWCDEEGILVREHRRAIWQTVHGLDCTFRDHVASEKERKKGELASA